MTASDAEKEIMGQIMRIRARGGKPYSAYAPLSIIESLFDRHSFQHIGTAPKGLMFMGVYLIPWDRDYIHVSQGDYVR